MKWYVLALISCMELLVACNTEKQSRLFGHIERIDPSLDEVIDEQADVEIIADSLDWCEGPLWIEGEKMLLFSDIPLNTIYKWTKEKGKEVYLKPSGFTGNFKRGGEVGSNGLFLNKEGALMLCQHGDRRIAKMNAPLSAPRPDYTTIAAEYKGKKFDSPNDAVLRGNGDIFFTDPPYGLEFNAKDTNKMAPYQGVYKVSAAGTVSLLTDSISRPNGIILLPGEKSLIIANSDPEKAVWYIFEIGSNDSLVNGKLFYDATPESKKETGLPDGLKVNKKGIIFATGPGGVWIFNQQAKLLGKIKVDGVVSNCAFDETEKTLYLTADMYVLRVKLK